MDRITRLHIRNVRAIEHLELQLGTPLTVLIGENGAGKSTILECLELLRKAAEPRFMELFYEEHRGLPGLLRKGAGSLELAVDIEDDEGLNPPLRYGFQLAPRLAGAVVQTEQLTQGGDFNVIRRSPVAVEYFDEREAQTVVAAATLVGNISLLISSFGSAPPHPAFARVLAVLQGIEVHLPFDTAASWVARHYQFARSMRSSTMLRPAEKLQLLGFNLANAWSEIKNGPSAAFARALDLVRLGLGQHVDNVVTPADPGGGQIALALTMVGLSEPVMAADLSDGQLAWLAFVALTHFNAGRSLLAMDEVEQHLHPSLLGRVIMLLSNLPGGAPVILSTHSDRVLELLDDPADAVRVCSLEDGRATITRLDAETLPAWLAEFGDVGQLRAAGYLPRVTVEARLENSTPMEELPTADGNV